MFWYLLSYTVGVLILINLNYDYKYDFVKILLK